MQTRARKVRLPTAEGVHAAHCVQLEANFKIQLKIMAEAKKSETFSVCVYGISLRENKKMFTNTHLSGACHRKMSFLTHSTRLLTH